MIVYNTDTGMIIADIPNNSDPKLVLEFHEEIINNRFNIIELNKRISNISEYIVINGELIQLSPIEIGEIRNFGKILSTIERDEQRKIYNLTPSDKEIQKAENTIEILELLSEVL